MSTELTQRGANNSLLAANVEKTVLSNGVRVLTDSVPHTHSATFAVWVGVGGRDEPAEIAGASHFLEHLLFQSIASFHPIDRDHHRLGNYSGHCYSSTFRRSSC